MDQTQPKRRRRKRDYIAPVLAVIALAFVTWSYARWSRARALPEDPQVLQAELKKSIPSGTRLTEAQRTMLEWGFDCMSLKSSKFADQGPFDYLYCDQQTATASAVARRWQVALVEKNGGVEDVLVTTGLIGP